MSYEQKYKEALKWMRSLYSGLHGATKEDAEHYFPELKENEDEKIRQEIRNFIWGYPDKLPERDKWLAWFEKQSEKRPTDEVEPKFKVGDWVLNNVCFPMQIVSIKDGMYIFTEGDAMSVSFVDENYHLWSIQDAEDGDVLALISGQCIFLFDGYDKEYCHYSKLTNSFSPNLNYIGFIQHQFVPATKEQRDLLFSKMKEAGYEWDSEKKELKQNEVKKEVKKLDADKVIEWLKNTIGETKEYFGGYGVCCNNTHLTLPYNSIEDLINDFKEDFGL